MRSKLKILLISILTLLLFCSVGITVFAMPKEENFPKVSFKGDYGFERHSVVREDVGLNGKQYYNQILALEDGNFWTFAPDRRDFDGFLIQLAIEGMLNRVQPILFMNQNTYNGHGPAENKIYDTIWTDYYEDPAHQGIERVDLGYLGLAKMVEKFGPYFNGIILYDYDGTPENPSSNLALGFNLASANFCIPMKKDFYYSNIESFKGLPIVADVTNNGMTMAQSYRWMINNLYGKKGEKLMMNKHALHSLNLDLGDMKGEWTNWPSVQGIDFAFKENVFMFNITPFSYEDDRFTSSPELGNVVTRLLEGVDGEGEPGQMYGWNSPEHEWVDRLAPYGIVVEATTSASNTSFHSVMDPWTKTREEVFKTGFEHKRANAPSKKKAVLKALEEVRSRKNKVYISFASNEGDAMKTRTNQNQRAWYSSSTKGTNRLTRAEEGNKEKFPISWSMTASQLKTVPAIIEYYYITATDQDEFVSSPTGGAGYTSLGGSLKRDEYIRAARKYFDLLDIHYGDFWYGEADSIENYVNGLNDLRGVTLDLNYQFPSGGFTRVGEKGTPAFRYSTTHMGWMGRGSSPADNTYWIWNSTGNHFNTDKFFNEFESVRKSDESRPHFMPFYGMEDDALKLVWDELLADPRWDPDKYQIVDTGTMLELWSEDDRAANGEPKSREWYDNQADAEKLEKNFTSKNSWKAGGGTISELPGAIKYTAGRSNDMMTGNLFYLPPNARELQINYTTSKDDLGILGQLYADWDGDGVISREEKAKGRVSVGQDGSFKLSQDLMEAAKTGRKFGIDFGLKGSTKGESVTIDKIGFVEFTNTPYLHGKTLKQSNFWTHMGVKPQNIEFMDHVGVKVQGGQTGFFNAKLDPYVTGMEWIISGTVGATPTIKISTNNGTISYTVPALKEGDNKITMDFNAIDAEAYEAIRGAAERGSALKFEIGGGKEGQFVQYTGVKILADTDPLKFTDTTANDLTKWNHGDANLTALPGGGFRLQHPTSDWSLAVAYVKIDPEASYLKIVLGDAADKVMGIVKFFGNLNGFNSALMETYWTYGTTEKVVYVRIDQRVLNQPQEIWQLQIGYQCARGFIEYKEIKMITEEQFEIENEGTWQIGDPDPDYGKDHYDVDKNKDGIRDGDEQKSPENLRLTDKTLSWDAVDSAETYFVQVIDSEGKVVSRISRKTEIKLSFLKEGNEYTFKVYARAAGKPDSAVVEMKQAYGEVTPGPVDPNPDKPVNPDTPETPDQPEEKGGCGSNIGTATVLFVSLGLILLACGLKKSLKKNNFM